MILISSDTSVQQPGKFFVVAWHLSSTAFFEHTFIQTKPSLKTGLLVLPIKLNPLSTLASGRFLVQLRFSATGLTGHKPINSMLDS